MHLDSRGQRRDRPPADVEIGCKHALIPAFQEGAGSRAADVKMSRVFASGFERLALLDADRLEDVDHSLSRASHGSICTTRSSDWKKRRSYGMVES